MKILISQNNQQSGPFSTEEVREQVYKGEIQRTALARPEEGGDWVPLETLLNPQPLPPMIDDSPAPALPFERLRDSKELTALTWLYIASGIGWIFLAIWTVASYGILLLIVGVGLLLALFGHLWFVAYLKTNAVRVSPTQLPDLYRLVRTCCKRLDMAPPDVYVMQQNVWNAFAAKVLGRRMVVLLSGAVDSLLLKGDMQQVAWVLGHELGHHRAGHLDLSRKLANVGDWCVWLKLWYSRRCEFTCDRIGLYCAGNLQASQLALINATVGAQLAARVNVVEAIQQWRLHRSEFFVRYRTLYATHPHLLARLDHLNAAAAELGLAR